MTQAEARAVLAQIRVMLDTPDDSPEGSMGERWIVQQIAEVIRVADLGRAMNDLQRAELEATRALCACAEQQRETAEMMRENHRLKAEHTRLCNEDLSAAIEALQQTIREKRGAP